MRDPIDDELAFHFEQLKQERLAAGDSEAEALRYAQRRLGNRLGIEEEVRDLGWFHRLETVVRHARFAWRSYRHHAGAYGLATAILAVGIGLSVAMFSLVQAVVLSPLPFPGQENVHLIWKIDTQLKQNVVGELAYPELADLQANPAIEKVALIPAALYGNGRVLQRSGQEPVQIEGCPTTPDLFRVLGVKPALGRDFAADDRRVVILSDRVWRAHFSARPSVIGEAVNLNGVAHTVIGVMAAAVDFPRGAGLWVPINPDPNRGLTYLQAVARVRPGQSPNALRAAVDTTFRAQIADHLNEYSATQRGVVTPLADFLTGSSKLQLLVSLFASGLLLLSAAVSAGNLFLSRTLTRRREVATRVALGASRGQVLAQFAAEAGLAAGLASVAGAVLAYAAIRALVHWAPPDIPRLESAHLDLRAFALAVALAGFATLGCLVGPVLVLWTERIDKVLRQARGSGSRAGRRLQDAFVFAQAGLSVAILAVGLFLYLSDQAMRQENIGFQHEEVLTLNLAFRRPQADLATRRAFYNELLRRLRAAPEVTHAAAVLLRPMEGPIGWDTEYQFEFEAGQRDPNLLTKANFEVVTPGYFETVGTPLLEGRDFDERDDEQTEKRVIISQSLARRMRASGHSPLGQRMRTFGAWRTVVGVVADARYRRVVEAMDDVYVPYRQAGAPTNYVVLRGSAPVDGLLSVARRVLKEIDSSQAIASPATLRELRQRQTARSRFSLSLMLLFAAGAVLLAAAGMHSVISESVTVRAKEIAVKSALGAGQRRLVAECVGRALRWAVLGEVAGMLLAFVLARALAEMLYQVSPSNPITLGSVGLLVLAVTAGAALAPAWMAVRQDPREALQSDLG
ncbi:MAG: ABC transporter permease [Bryobacteraceae bacterium]|nr:ABC transporter permease [Bryobacteraceae bacterium]